MQRNTCLEQLNGNYFFTEIVRRTQAYKAAHPDARILRLGIGDVTRPLSSAVTEAMHRAVEEMAHEETFRGYGPEEGYKWLRAAIIENDFRPRGVDLVLEKSQIEVSNPIYTRPLLFPWRDTRLRRTRPNSKV